MSIEELTNYESRLKKSIESCDTGDKSLDCSTFEIRNVFDVTKDDASMNIFPKSIFVEEFI